MGKYDDIINLKHHQSKNHPQMSNYNRAAQFAPFAALVGYAEAITASEERFEQKIELSEDRKEEIGVVLQEIKKQIKDKPNVEVTYFTKKNNSGEGKYIKYIGMVKTIDIEQGKIAFVNRKSISINNIYNIVIKKEV